MSLVARSMEPEIEIQALKSKLATSEANNERLAERCQELHQQNDFLRAQWARFLKILLSALPEKGGSLSMESYRATCAAAVEITPQMIKTGDGPWVENDDDLRRKLLRL